MPVLHAVADRLMSTHATITVPRKRPTGRLRAAGVCAGLLAACGTATSHAPRPTTVAAPTTVAPTTTTTTPLTKYQVKRGDTLTSIAKEFGVSVAVIVATNHLANANQLSVGQVLQVPPAPPALPAQLAITPAQGPAGQGFTLVLTGAKPAEVVTFQIDSPGGATFTGPPHTASSRGVVTATYRTTPVDVPGTYTITAKGDHRTSARASLRVNPVGPTP
jgi:LysM repeat protein